MFVARRWKYMRVLLSDGNFKQEHLKMKYPADDVPLSDGHGYMVGRQEFADYRDRVLKAPAPSTKVRNFSIVFPLCFLCRLRMVSLWLFS